MVKFYSFSDRPHARPEPGSGIVKVERSGYIPAKARIEALMISGQNLLQARAEQFHFADPKEVPDDYYDVTTERGVDIVDVTRVARILRLRAEERARKQEEEIAAAKAKAAADEQAGSADPGKKAL